MGQKKTELDEEYAEAFAGKLRPHYLAAKSKGQSDRAFASTLEISDTQLQNYLVGRATPSLRTVALAMDKYRIAVPYGKLPANRLLGRHASKTPKSGQLLLPFSIRQRTAKKIALSVNRKSANQIDFLLKIG